MKKYFKKPQLKFLPILFIGVASAFTSCKKDNSNGGSATTAKVKIVNAADGSASQDLYIDNVKLDASAVAYTQSSDYFTENAGSHSAKFTNTGSTTANVAFNVTLQADSSYTIYYTGSNATQGSIVTTNNLTAPSAGMARVRIINLSTAAAANIDFGLSATSKLVTNLAYRAVSAYNTINANTALYLYAAGSIDAMLNIPATTIQAGKIYTIYISGSTAIDIKYNIVAEN